MFVMLLSLAAGAQVIRGARVQAPSCSCARSLLVLQALSGRACGPGFRLKASGHPGPQTALFSRYVRSLEKGQANVCERMMHGRRGSRTGGKGEQGRVTHKEPHEF